MISSERNIVHECVHQEISCILTALLSHSGRVNYRGQAPLRAPASDCRFSIISGGIGPATPHIQLARDWEASRVNFE